MSSAAHRGDDDIAFFAADIGYTYLLSASSVVAQTSDAGGALRPGRYLIQARNISAGVVWIGVTGFEKAKVADLTAGPGPRRVPLSADGLVAIETNVLPNDSDRVMAITSGGTADVYITLLSRSA